jgi:hypothetical protein
MFFQQRKPHSSLLLHARVCLDLWDVPYGCLNFGALIQPTPTAIQPTPAFQLPVMTVPPPNGMWAPMHNSTGLNRSQVPPNAPNFGSPAAAASAQNEDTPHPAPPGQLLSFLWQRQMVRPHRCSRIGQCGGQSWKELFDPRQGHPVMGTKPSIMDAYLGGREQWAQRVLGTTSTPAAASKSVLGPY